GAFEEDEVATRTWDVVRPLQVANQLTGLVRLDPPPVVAGRLRLVSVVLIIGFRGGSRGLYRTVEFRVSGSGNDFVDREFLSCIRTGARECFRGDSVHTALFEC